MTYSAVILLSEKRFVSPGASVLTGHWQNALHMKVEYLLNEPFSSQVLSYVFKVPQFPQSSVLASGPSRFNCPQTFTSGSGMH